MPARMRGRMNMKTKWGQKEETRVRALLRRPAEVWQAARQAVFCVIITHGENNYLKAAPVAVTMIPRTPPRHAAADKTHVVLGITSVLTITAA